MKILITGASGYLAWELIRQLSEAYDVNIIGTSSDPEKLRSDKNYSEVRLMNNQELLSSSLKDIDIIIHTAFCRKSVGKDLVKSLKFSQKLFRKAVEEGIRGIINISSQSVYIKPGRVLSRFVCPSEKRWAA